MSESEITESEIIRYLKSFPNDDLINSVKVYIHNLKDHKDIEHYNRDRMITSDGLNNYKYK